MSRQRRARHRSAKPRSQRCCFPLIGSSYARRLRVEQLEDWRMLAVLIVQNVLDDTLEYLAGDGQLSLREAIELANSPGESIDGFSSIDGDFDGQEFVFWQHGLYSGSMGCRRTR